MNNTTTNISLARRVIAATEANDEAALDDLIHPSFRGHGGQEETSGLDGMRGTLRWLHATFDGMTSTPEDLIASDDRVVARVRFRATPKLPIDGIEPSGRSIDVEHVHIWRVAEGKLAEHWLVRDDLTAMRQLGAVPAPA